MYINVSIIIIVAFLYWNKYMKKQLQNKKSQSFWHQLWRRLYINNCTYYNFADIYKIHAEVFLCIHV